jgi:L-methionine (R)-S-oxide reductase
MYQDLSESLRSLISDEKNSLANASQFIGFINQWVDDINWVGFYFLDGDELVLGPFQGKVACVRIPMGRGVCGTAAATQKTQLVEDVHAFDGHIACDAASNSEIVIPIIEEGKLIGVLDIDSPSIGRFNEDDKLGLELWLNIAQPYINFSKFIETA